MVARTEVLCSKSLHIVMVTLVEYQYIASNDDQMTRLTFDLNSSHWACAEQSRHFSEEALTIVIVIFTSYVVCRVIL